MLIPWATEPFPMKTYTKFLKLQCVFTDTEYVRDKGIALAGPVV